MKVKLLLWIMVLIGVFVFQGYSMKKDKIRKVKVSEINYKGWINSIQITNNNLKMVIVPSIGRIMFFGFIDGKNMLWNNVKFLGENIEYTDDLLATYFWANYGGDKVWTVEQKDFPKTIKRTWPPDETFDGGVFEYELLHNGVKLISAVSKYTNTRLIREITTEPDVNKFTIAQTVICEGENSVVPATIWNVSQVLPPEKFVVDWNKESKFDGGIKFFRDVYKLDVEHLDGKKIITNLKNDTLKIGTDSKRFVTSVWDNIIFTQSFNFIEGETYPDGGTAVELMITPAFVEMELLSHLKMLEKGEKLEFDIEWRLDKLPDLKNRTIVDVVNNQIN